MTYSLDILVIGAHADDAEIGMGGTIVKHTRAGIKVGICDLTLSELSSNGTVESRKREAEQAARILGVQTRSNLELPDSGLFIGKESIETIAMEIRRLRPRIVFAPYWHDRHPDHVLCSQLVQEAVFTAKLRRYRPDVEPVTVDQLYFYFINDVVDPDLIVDITEYQSVKMEALSAYRSQFEMDPAKDSVQTPLTQGYLERVEARDRLLGQKKQMGGSEGFMTKLPYLIDLF